MAALVLVTGDSAAVLVLVGEGFAVAGAGAELDAEFDEGAVEAAPVSPGAGFAAGADSGFAAGLAGARFSPVSAA